jgi:hypothetical protein
VSDGSGRRPGRTLAMLIVEILIEIEQTQAGVLAELLGILQAATCCLSVVEPLAIGWLAYKVELVITTEQRKGCTRALSIDYIHPDGIHQLRGKTRVNGLIQCRSGPGSGTDTEELLKLGWKLPG